MQSQKLGRKPPVILCVDDDASVLTLVKAVLEREGYSVISADNGQAALDMFRTTGVDAVVLDYDMPHMNGAQVARELKHLNPRIPKVLFTGGFMIPSNSLQMFQGICQKLDGPRALVSCLKSLLRKSSPDSGATLTLRTHIQVANFSPEWKAACP